MLRILLFLLALPAYAQISCFPNCGGGGGGAPSGPAGGVLNGTYPDPGFNAPNAANGPVVLNGSGNASLPGTLTIGTTVLCAAVGVNTGTSYTLSSANNGCVLTFNNAAAITLTVPSGLPVGFSCLVVQLGAGQVTPTASSTTILQRQSFTKTAGQYAVATLLSHATNTYILAGDLQ